MAFKYKVEGEFFTAGKLSGIEFYEAYFVLQTSHISEARSVIQKTLISDYLRKNVKNYKRWKTCQVVSVEQTEENPSVSGALEKLTVEAAAMGVVPANLGSYAGEKSKEKKLNEVVQKAKSKREEAILKESQ